MGMLGILTLVLVGLTAYGFMRQGIVFGAAATFSAVFAGMLAFQVWPSVAPELENIFADSFLKGWQDAIAMIVVFVLVFSCVFMGTLVLGKREFGFAAKTDQVGGIFFGGLTGYLISGFLLCAIQTLPLKEHFLGFTYGIAGRAVPADQVWLKLMNRNHRGALGSGDDHSQLLQEFSKTCAHDRRRPKPGGEPPAPEPASQPPPSDPNTLTPGKRDVPQ